MTAPANIPIVEVKRPKDHRYGMIVIQVACILVAVAIADVTLLKGRLAFHAGMAAEALQRDTRVTIAQVRARTGW